MNIPIIIHLFQVKEWKECFLDTFVAWLRGWVLWTPHPLIHTKRSSEAGKNIKIAKNVRGWWMQAAKNVVVCEAPHR
jgi:hypothetical protein